MALQIEAPETIRLVEELARRTGEGAETVVQIALQERLARLRTPEEEAARRARVYALIDELAGYRKDAPEMTTDHGELLYGEDGLPREGELSEYELKFYNLERYTLPEDVDGGEAWRSRSKDQRPSE
jgi:hypothetical protein